MADSVSRLLNKNATMRDRETVLKDVVEQGAMHWHGEKRSHAEDNQRKGKKSAKKVSLKQCTTRCLLFGRLNKKYIFIHTSHVRCKPNVIFL